MNRPLAKPHRVDPLSSSGGEGQGEEAVSSTVCRFMERKLPHYPGGYYAPFPKLLCARVAAHQRRLVHHVAGHGLLQLLAGRAARERQDGVQRKGLEEIAMLA